MRISLFGKTRSRGTMVFRMVGSLAVVAVVAAGVAAGVVRLFPVVVPVIAQLAGGSSIPQQINHQGVVTVDGKRFNGNGLFRFAIVNTATGNNLWSNDGSNVPGPGQPSAAVTLTVTDGIYSVMLGDTGMTNMTAISAGVFDTTSVALRIWFDDGTNGVQQLIPDQPLTSAPFAFRAKQADNGAIVGEIKMWAGSDANTPSGWMICNGAAVSRSTYASLYAAIGTNYGAGDGSTTFNLPDLRQKFPLGKADSGTGSTLGASGGAIDHTHTGPSHTHTYSDVIAHVHSVDPPATTSGNNSVGHTHTWSDTTSSAGSHSHGMNSTVKDAYWGLDCTCTARNVWSSGGWGDVLTTASAGAHTHTVSGTTSGISANHTHITDIAAFNTASTGMATGTTAASGTDATGTGNPPFVVVNYMIYVGQ